MTTLQMINVNVAFGGLVVLCSASLSLERGTRFGLMGANGSGKSTLLSVLGGQLPTPSGSVWLDGKDISRLGVVARARLGLIRMFQESRLWENMSVAENLRCLIDVKGGDGVDRMRQLRLELDLEGAWLRRTPEALTLHQRRRVELCVAMFGARILLCDELGAGLNLMEARALYSVVHRAVQAGRIEAALLVDHKQTLLDEFCCILAVMASGQPVRQRAPDGVKRSSANPVPDAYPARLAEGLLFCEDQAR